jgi:hypothetical protein
LKNVEDDPKTMLKKVVRKYESKLKHVEENSIEKLKESNKMLKDVTREYGSKLKNVEEDSNKVLNAVNKFYKAAMKDVEMDAISKTKEKMNASKTELNRVIKDVAQLQTQCAKKEAGHQAKLIELESDHHNQVHSVTIELQVVIEAQKHVLYDEKMRCHELVTKSNTKLKSVKAKLEEKIVAMRDWVEEMGEEAQEATCKMNKAVKAEEKSRNLASMRLTKLIQLKHDLGDAHDSLADESKQCAALEEMSTVRLEIKCERLCGH